MAVPFEVPGDLFRHLTTDKADFYRVIMNAFAAAKRQFRLHLRPDEVRAEARWRTGPVTTTEEVQQALSQLVEWGNLQSQPDTARVSTIEDFYRARFLYSLTAGGEAVETGLEAFAQALARRAELQSVALEDILARLSSLRSLAAEEPLDAAKVHQGLRDLVTVFSGLAENAQAFMAGLARNIELQRADVQAVMTHKAQLIDYLERFIGDLVTRSARIAVEISELSAHSDRLLRVAVQREMRDAAPDGSSIAQSVDPSEEHERLESWRERWNGLAGWFVGSPGIPAQSELLRARARGAIPRLLAAVSAINERRSGRSDRSADYRVLARWFAETESDADAHKLWRASFALSPARHLSFESDDAEVPASSLWSDAPTVRISPRLRERGSLARRGAPPRVRDRTREREFLAARMAEESAQVQRARSRLASSKATRLSHLGSLNRHEFDLFLALLSEALSAQMRPDMVVERSTSDGLLRIRLEPLSAQSRAELDTELGRFAGRDHVITITPMYGARP